MLIAARGNLNDLQAAFSHAYIRAVAHAAGYFVSDANRERDGDGVDLTIFERGAGGMIRSPHLDIQAKSTATPVLEDVFPYDLVVKNYNELCASNYQIPRILVVVSVPKDASDWVHATQQELVLRHCGYWISLRGEKESANSATVRVRMSRSQPFHVAELQSLMQRIRAGGHP